MYNLTITLLVGSILTQLLALVVFVRQIGVARRYRWEWSMIALAGSGLLVMQLCQLEMALSTWLYDVNYAVLSTVVSLFLVSAMFGLRGLVRDIQAQTRQLETLATTDVLTGLSNRRHTFERGAQELLRAGRSGEVVALLLLDVDGLRLINEHHGLPAGDAVLVAVADVLRAGLRQIDVVGRIGGEEFVLLLPNTDEAAAAVIAERLRQRVEQLGVVLHNGERVNATVTLAVVTGQGAEQAGPESFRHMLMQADVALNIAKERAKNTVIAWVPDMAIQPS